MTKIFITIPWFLPAFRAGGPIQSVANLVREYSEDVQYYIFCGDTDLNGAALENVITGEWTPYNDYTSVWYAGHERISDSLVTQAEAIEPDIIYIIGIYSWHFNIVPLIYCKAPKKILSTRGMLHPGALSQKKWKKKFYLQVFKLLEYHHKVTFHATDAEEEKYTRQYFGKPAMIHVAGNFPNNIGALAVAGKDQGKLSLLSIALISPMKNILLVLEALEQVAATVEYTIYGPIKDIDYWERCKEKIKTLPPNIKVSYRGEVEPSKIRTALENNHLFILPSKSENFGHAIYEALSAARPVITSNNTPWNNLEDSKAGCNVPIDSMVGLKKAIDFFASMDEETLSQWSHGAIEYAANAIDMENTRQQYREMFQLPIRIDAIGVKA